MNEQQSSPPWLDTPEKQQWVEKILLMGASAVISFIVATWYAGRTLGIIDAMNLEQNARLAKLEGTDITAGARVELAALKAHMQSDDLNHVAFTQDIQRLETQQQLDRQQIMINGQRITSLEEALRGRGRVK